MVTKLYRENVCYKLPGYQKWLSTIAVTLPNSFIRKMYGSYQVTRLPDVTEEVICTIHMLVVAVTSQLPNGYQAL